MKLLWEKQKPHGITSHWYLGNLIWRKWIKIKEPKAKKPKTLKSNSLLSYLNLTENRPKESPNVFGAAMWAQKKRHKLAQKHTAFTPWHSLGVQLSPLERYLTSLSKHWQTASQIVSFSSTVCMYFHCPIYKSMLIPTRQFWILALFLVVT